METSIQEMDLFLHFWPADQQNSLTKTSSINISSLKPVLDIGYGNIKTGNGNSSPISGHLIQKLVLN